MAPETIAAIQSALAPIAEKIGQGAAFSWETVVRQQYINGITGLIWVPMWIGIGIASIFFFRFSCKKNFDKSEANYSARDEWWAGIVLSVIICVGAFLVACGTATDAIQHMLNPNYYALQFFIDLARSKD